MPYIETLTTEQQAHILIWQLNEELPALLALWGEVPLPTRYMNVTADKRRCEILATALLLRQHFGHDVAVQYTSNGAPHLNKGYISISHTRNYVVIALHDKQRVGVDIEQLGEKVMRVASRFISPSEQPQLPSAAALLPDGSSARNVALHLAWSIKEALYKIYPTAVDFARDMHLSPFTTLPQGSITAHLPATGVAIEAFYCRYNDCSLAWVVE